MVRRRERPLRESTDLPLAQALNSLRLRIVLKVVQITAVGFSTVALLLVPPTASHVGISHSNLYRISESSTAHS
ncbi:hypothetical protein OH76DRAFT_684357 [Lentinus brumalis]|uniref:Uncharacterized protein n=1 Tax=Lentinus brumalis TaxID=2498619 RepID=A0A371D6R1_9APHY|nr:hypothetical protein OH76DRAFT_684357 [Polyporus brumalis]